MKAELPLNLPENVRRILGEFVGSTSAAFGDQLVSIILFGSGAEGRLRPTSDVNVVIVLSEFDPARASLLSNALGLAHAAIRLSPMFVLESEIPHAMEAFAVKFGDIARRHTVLFGTDPFAKATIPRSAALARLKQTLLNLTLRMRHTHVMHGLREDRAAASIADDAGPLRACAVTLLELQGSPAPSPRDALEKVSARLVPEISADLMRKITEARINRFLPPGEAIPAFLALCDLARGMWAEAEKL